MREFNHRRFQPTSGRANWALALVALIALSLLVGSAGCRGAGRSLFSDLTDARERSAELRVQFTKAVDASNRAVMADTDEASIRFASQANEAKSAVAATSTALEPLLHALNYEPELADFDAFRRCFAEYQALDESILALAVENSNLKAQKLSFGPARDAADKFKAALEAAAKSSAPRNQGRAQQLAYEAIIAVREIQVLQAPHIAEADGAAMSRIEKQMDGQRDAARSAVRELSSLAQDAPSIGAASAALDQFNSVNAEIISLSRKNTNVRSLALALGDKTRLGGVCDSSLATLQQHLSAEGLKATR